MIQDRQPFRAHHYQVVFQRLQSRAVVVELDLRQTLKAFAAMNQDQDLLILNVFWLVMALRVRVVGPVRFSEACQVLFFLRLLLQ